MTGKELISLFLKRQGIDKVFCFPGIYTLSLLNCLLSNGISIYMARCERSLLFMADGYSRASGRQAIAIVPPGPGLVNSLVGLMEAFWSETPLLLLYVDPDSKYTGRGIFHELSEPHKMVESVTKTHIKIESEESFFHDLKKSFTLTTFGRPGPVFLSINQKFLEKNVEYNWSEKQESRKISTIGDFAEKLVRCLNKKRRPLIIAGWQLMNEKTGQLLEELCNDAKIPLLTTTGGKGVVDERRPYAFGNIVQRGTVRKILEEADLVIAIGTRLRYQDTKNRGITIKELVHIDVDQEWFNKNYKTSLAEAGNLELFLNILKEAFKGRKSTWSIDKLKENYTRDLDNFINNSGYRIIRTIRQSIPEETMTVWDLNTLFYWAEYYFPVYKQRTFLTPRGSSTIFYGLPAAIGAKIARMDLPCLCICGDGGILPSIGELATMVKYKIPVVILIHNNKSFGTLEAVMKKRHKVRNQMNLENPDFVKLAKAFGIKAKKTKTEEELSNALRRIDWDEPLVIEFFSEPFESPWEVR
ncbi:MAG: thiamine pyrophosphate-binding protein [Deltaproteobacteria bacterium]|nr:thiamine pyrophosphate-binding protein [Deltaproteobacteria bacterium]